MPPSATTCKASSSSSGGPFMSHAKQVQIRQMYCMLSSVTFQRCRFCTPSLSLFFFTDKMHTIPSSHVDT